MRVFLAVFSLLVGLISGQELKSLLDMCAKQSKTMPLPLSDKIVLPEAYKVSGSVTDWMKASTSLIVETATQAHRVLQRQSRDQEGERWIENLTGDKQTMFVNVSSGDCDAKGQRPQLIAVPRFSNIIGSDTSSLNSIIRGLVDFDKNHTGFLIDDHIEIVGGVNSVKWVSCVEGASPNDTKVLLEVRYAGEGTIRPAQTPFSNPLLLSIRLAELPTFNSTVALNHISLEVDRYEMPVGDEAKVEHGIYCRNRNSSTLPLKSLDEYAAVLNYYDHGTNKSEVVDVLYSKSRKIFIVAGHSFENGIKILKSNADKYRNGTDYILHDFKYGYEFTMKQDGCESFSTLDDSTADVMMEQNSTFSMKPMEMLLVDPALRWDEYQSDIDMTGTFYKTYRAFDARDETIAEIHLTEDGEVHSLATFRQGSRHLAVSLTVSRIPVESSRLNLKATQLAECYDSGNFSNNTWIFDVKDKHLVDISKVGLDNLNEAVASSISQNVYPVIPYRILVFYLVNRDDGLSVVLRIADKTEKPPGPVGYNVTAELSTLELFQMLNATIISEKMPIVVENVDGVKEEWIADAKTMKMFPPEKDSGFIGYTGGAMFVLTIFCLLIGVSIGAVGVFVATRRQRISTLAYQVFE
uniref:Peptidase S72 domain-containing protein n=1 Tax=Caenorhabditis japonica TaxID=281687 RepID=A0A8R1HSD0_CAEJA